MQRSLTGDIEIGFERVARDRRTRIYGRDAVPIEVNARTLNLFDLDQQCVSCDAIANSGVKDGDD